jgi:preprotein translocase subunit YajC
MFITQAFANNVANITSTITTNLMPIAIFILIFYWFLIRPQQKEQKKHEEMIKNLKVGDKVITAGGIIAIVKKSNEKETTLEIADDIKIKVLSETIKTTTNETK